MSQGPDLPDQKFGDLLSSLNKCRGAAIAFSGGVDSSFLLKAVAISGIRALAVVGESETMPSNAAAEAAIFAEEVGIECRVIRTEELKNENFASNPPDRCYYCKDELFRKIRAIADREGLEEVFDGSNADDRLDYRPGRRAAELHRVRSPLSECGFSKKEIREMSRRLGLDTWDRPSSPCLSSRFPYGRRITPGGLRRIEAAEELIRAMGVSELRVRDHGNLARIEVCPDDMPLLLKEENRHRIVSSLRASGFDFVSLDIEGFRSGSLNRQLSPKPLP